MNKLKGGMGEIKGVLLDLDGVLVESNLDFKKISQEIFAGERLPLLENISQIKHPPDRQRAYNILEKHETNAANTCRLKEGIPRLFEFLNRHNIKRGVVTRNSKSSVGIIMERFNLNFDAIVTREDASPKPARDPIILACRVMGLSSREVIFLGDHEFDMVAGRRAEVFTVLLKSCSHPSSKYASFTVESIPDFTSYLRKQLT